jgi:dipeptidyl aminopeptidase/acylaminoacyl peptidase
MEQVDFTGDFKHFTMIGSSPDMPGDVFYWNGKDEFIRLTDVNPWLKQRNIAKQEVIQYQARDGWEIEGMLIYPANYKSGKTYPLVVYVHGGPESHYSNKWISAYSRPGQVLANDGYFVFYPNYRASTGYGLEFAYAGYGDAAGREFDDVADGIDYLVQKGFVDKNRVGLAGGSYGGYASAWFGTYYTEKVRAVCMFVGISDLVSKRSTTDIPYEELYVHSGKPLEEMWQFSLERSPVYHAHKSKTAFLIYGGAADTRVHPAQSLELYRRLKMNDHPAVRLVQYPGEKHGNSKQPGRTDVLYRQISWFDWYVKNAKPLDGPMPPLDISDKYGLELPAK